MYLGVVFLYIYLAWVSLRFQDLQTDIFRENGKLIFFLFQQIDKVFNNIGADPGE